MNFIPRLLIILFAAMLLANTPQSRAENAARPIGEPVLEPATLHCLAVHWFIHGDDNQNASVAISYRKTGGTKWIEGPPLLRVERNSTRNEHGQSSVEIPPDSWLFAGTVFVLEPGTEYELKLAVHDPDGGDAQHVLRYSTISEPVAPKDARVLWVSPGSGDGDGSEKQPFRGLDAAQKAARPGDIFLLHAGVYPGTFKISKSGEPGRPIIWRGAGDGEVIIDGQKPDDHLTDSAIEASGVHDVWFEGLSIRSAYRLIRASESSRLVVRRCHLSNAICGIVAAKNDTRKVNGFFISDNVIEGIMPWPTTRRQWETLPESRGIWLTGSGHVVCYNRITHFKDAMDTDESPACFAIDFHNNDVSEMFDDGTEMDGSERNTRCFFNRYTNVFQGISLQPVYGGPVYVFRNALYNVQVEAFKLHNRPSGGIIVHNTVVKYGVPLVLSTRAEVHDCVFRNNLFVGTSGDYAAQLEAPMINCDFDCDGFAGGPFAKLLKWNGVRYATIEEIRAKSPAERHATIMDSAHLFASGVSAPTDSSIIYQVSINDLRLAPGAAAIDAGQIMPGFNDDFAGAAPDLGAYESGKPMPHYGPRPVGSTRR